MKIYKIILMAVAITPIIFLQSCLPSIARTNARIENGFSGGITGAYSHAKDTSFKQDDGDIGQFELNGQYAKKKNNDIGFAVQLKTGLVSLTGLDFYLEAPSKNHFHYGIGVELGFENGGYIVGTYYPTEEMFITVTGRIVKIMNETPAVFNPQLAIGFDPKDGSIKISLFAGYHYFTDSGYIIDAIGDVSVNRKANNVYYGGISFGF